MVEAKIPRSFLCLLFCPYFCRIAFLACDEHYHILALKNSSSSTE